MSKERLSVLFTSVLVGCALVVTGLVIMKQVTSSPATSTDIRYVQEWEYLTVDGHAIGVEDAPVKIVEFFDYQCPYCKKARPVLEEIRRRYPEQVVLILRHLPLSNHEHAVAAARAAECAAEQDRFAAYHDLLFIHQADLSNIPWSELARQSGVSDVAAFQECTGAGVVNPRIERNVEAARSLGIRSVPTFIVNGSLVSGAVSVEVLDRMVRRAISDHNG